MKDEKTIKKRRIPVRKHNRKLQSGKSTEVRKHTRLIEQKPLKIQSLPKSQLKFKSEKSNKSTFEDLSYYKKKEPIQISRKLKDYNEMESQYQYDLTVNGEKVGGAFIIEYNDGINVIESIFVDKDKQDKGYGSKLLENITNEYDKKEKPLILYATSQNKIDNLIKFYEKAGFKRTNNLQDTKTQVEMIHNVK